MSQADQSIEWFLARDGQQHGPIRADEMSKIIEMGYLLPNDLVWRQGFSDWQPASSALPSQSGIGSASRRVPARRRPAPLAPPLHRVRLPIVTQRPSQRSTAPPRRNRIQAPAAKAADPREIIAQEAARREESARRARGEFQPGGPRQAMSPAPQRAEPLRADPMPAGRDPASHDAAKSAPRSGGGRARPQPRDRKPEKRARQYRALTTGTTTRLAAVSRALRSRHC